MDHIKGGYYMKARCIQHSEISRCSPCTREVWDWLLMNARYEDQKRGDYTIKRGQVFTRYKDIKEDLCWYVGFAKKTYTEDAMKTAMKTLRKHSMITSMKTRGGMLITICNYDKYQDSKNYEATNEDPNEVPMKPPRSHQGSPDILKEGKEGEEEKQLYYDLHFKTKDGVWMLPIENANKYIQVFPNLDVEKELKKAAMWTDDNPKKRKKPGGMKSFITKWLNRAEERRLEKNPKPKYDESKARPLTPEEEAFNKEMLENGGFYYNERVPTRRPDPE